MFQTTRYRLALWYTILTAVLLLVFATGFYFYVRTTLIERIDDTLKHVVEVVERSLVVEPTQNTASGYQVSLEASFRDNGGVLEDDHIEIEWFSPNGKLLWSTFSEPLDIPLNPKRVGETVADHLLRQFTERVDLQRLVASNSRRHFILGYLRVSHPWFEVTKPIRQLIFDLTLGTIFTIGCVAAMGWFLSGIAMKPVKDSYQSLKQFTADASHELRNPIAMIQTNVQMALNYPEAEPQLLQRQLQVVERLTKRLGNLVNDLLFLARSDSGIVQVNFQPLSLDALLIEVIEEQRVVAEQKSIFLSLHLVEPQNKSLEDDIFTLKGDWDQLARLFTNLISNALEHTNSSDSQASIEVELKASKRDRQEYLQVEIKDNGVGIPESALPHLFDRFYRLDPARPHQQSNSEATSAGLGLAIAKAIVENHQGKIFVTSIINQGTTFTVMLPAAEFEEK
ncbi:MAG: HAMP domain-containing sensor histidine kinase [Spirulinaceae cyanobacterium]